MHVAEIRMLRWICGHTRFSTLEPRVFRKQPPYFPEVVVWFEYGIAAAIPGKSLKEVIEHYLVLVEDINDDSDIILPPNIEECKVLPNGKRDSSDCKGAQWPITDYVTEAFYTEMLPLPGPVKNCTTDAIEGPSAVDPEKFRLGAAVEGSYGVCCGVDTRTSPSLSLQPSDAGGSGMHIPPVNNVRYDPEELMGKLLIGSCQVGTTVNTASSPIPTADHIGVHGCKSSSNGYKDVFASTMGALVGGFSVDSMQLPSITGSSSGRTYPCWNPSSMDDKLFDLEDLFPDHIFGPGK
ncbi:hypothetical protein FXO38_01812 [Capsicum annuum]|nr:hypothetical protein FXO37_23527 [Capsicum annuum]KAF3681246.1 hypothetical protein FXO38_01812 [Capsicum annuum]